MSVPRIKVCCIASVAEARRAIDAGASALGLVSTMPSGPGVIAWETIAAIAAAVPPPIATFLLTCSQDAEEIVEQQRRCGTSVVQICDRLLRGSYAELRRALPGIRLVQVIHVVDTSSIDEARAAARHVDALLLDSGNQSLAVKELGGTGRVHDWTLSARIRESAGVPLRRGAAVRARRLQRRAHGRRARRGEAARLRRGGAHPLVVPFAASAARSWVWR